MELRHYIANQLKKVNVSPEEINAETKFILRHLFGIENFYLENNLKDFDTYDLTKIFTKRKEGYPLQYILGKSDFMDEVFFVDENVLIPRPETEILVTEGIKISKQINAKKILDIGTGSGCIPIMLKKNLPHVEVFSCDISKEALNIAKKNAQNLQQEVSFIQSDLFQNIKEKFDLIISNPPYIPPTEKANIQKEVSFEPSLALYTSDMQGIEFYEKIVQQAQLYLNNNGHLIFEIGINQANLVKSLFEDYNYSNIKIIQDLDGIERVISARI